VLDDAVGIVAEAVGVHDLLHHLVVHLRPGLATSVLHLGVKAELHGVPLCLPVLPLSGPLCCMAARMSASDSSPFLQPTASVC
jgi:hypothetical protein